MLPIDATQKTAPEAAGGRPDWRAIDTVLLDMDGTLLDLRFDNYFWLELVPRKYGAMAMLPVTFS